MEEYEAYVGNEKIDELYLGGDEIVELWAGNTLFWKKNTIKDYFEFTYSGATSFSASGSLSIFVDDVEKWSGEYAQRKSFSLPSGGTNVKIRGNLTDLSFYSSRITRILTPIPKSMGCKTSFADFCNMCFALEYIPDGLFANCPEVTDFKGCFTSCDLTKIPQDLFTNCHKVTTFYECFASNHYLYKIPEDLFANCPEVTDFEGCFAACNITKIPDELFTNCHKVTTFNRCFASNIYLYSIPDGLFANCPEVTDFTKCFAYCDYGISHIPEGLFTNCHKVITFKTCFAYCRLETIPSAALFANCPEVTDFTECFAWCGILGSTKGYAPELWVSYPNANGHNCFANLTGLSNYKDIPSSWK